MPESSTIIKVGSLNIWGTFANWPDRLSILREHPVAKTLDVLLAQEVCVGEEIDQLEDLSLAFDLPYYAFHSDKENWSIKEGVAIFSKKPLDTIGRTNLGNGRVLIEANSFNDLTLASAHLSFEGRERAEQVKKLLKRVTIDRVVLGADFNGHLSTFSKALDKYWDTENDDAATWPVCGPQFFEQGWVNRTNQEINFSLEPQRIDYILTRGVKHVNSETIPIHNGSVYASDHALVTNEIVI